ncbi:MAG: DUF4902 domain-containing protein [Betaproteobacteria bacterium]
MTAAWHVASWPPLLWQARAAAELRLVHLATQVLRRDDDDDDDARCSGHTVWATRASGGPAGMAWDWVRMPQGAVALADPLALLTNLWLLDGSGQVLSPLQAAPHLNGVVHRLPWQDEVQRALDGA